MNNSEHIRIFEKLEGFTIGLVALMFPVFTMAVLLH